MTPVIEVHPSWQNPTLPQASATWHWFFLEQWLEDAEFSQTQLSEQIVLEKNMIPIPILILAAWLVLEAIYRSGITSRELSTIQIRWARQTGLALLGSAPIKRHVVQPLAALSEIIDVFPQTQRARLRLALPVEKVRGEKVPAPELPYLPAKFASLVRYAIRYATTQQKVEHPHDA